MKKLIMFVFLILNLFLSCSFVSGVNWVDNSNRLYQFENDEIVTGYATDYNNKGSFTSVTKITETKKTNYVKDITNDRTSPNTNLIGLTQAFAFNKAKSFFYCSDAVKSVYYSSIDNLDLKELKPDYTPNETDYSIKCFDDPNDSTSNPSFLIVVFLGSNLKLKYKIDDKRWFLLYNAKGLTLDFVKLPYTKSEGNTENYLFVMKGDDNKLKISRVEFTFNGADANTVGFGEFPSDFVYYDKVQIGIDKEKTNCSSGYHDYVLLFTYNKGTTKFKYYYVYFENQNDPVVIKYGNEITFPFLNGYTIEDIKFIKGSQIFFYHIKKDSVSYIGAGDLLYGIQIYNIPKDLVEIISIDNTNYLSTKQNLVYSVKNELFTVCPFANKDACNIPNEPGHFLIDPNGNTETLSCNANIIEKYCVNECPSRYMISSGKCVECGGNTPFYDNVNKKCVSKCIDDLMEDQITKICYSCQSIGKYKYGKKCIDDCASVLAEPNKDGVCEVCKDKQLYFEDGKCVSQCSTKKGVYKEDGTCINCITKGLFLVDGKCKKSCLELQVYDEENICYYCYTTSKKYNERGRCVEQCSRIAATDSKKFVCTVCKDINKVLYNNECIESCPQYLVSDPENVCITCESIGKYYEKGECVDKCSEGYEANSTLHRCIFCKDESLFYFDEKCVDVCPDYYGYDEDNICYSCKSKDEYYEEGVCVKLCNPASAKNETEKVCVHCSIHDQYYEYNKCVDKCRDYEAIFEDNVCKYCHHYKEGYIYQNGTCVEHCNLGFENKEIGNIHVCESCGEYLYYHEHCLHETEKKDCPKFTIYNASFHGCYNCGDFGDNKTFYENGTCVISCSDGTEIDLKNKACRVCKMEGLYYEDEKCVGQCRNYSIIDPITWSCSNCSSSSHKYYLNITTCVDQCPKGYEANETINVCINCKEEGKVVYLNKCYDTCPNNTYVDKDSICKSCFCNGNNSKCVAEEKSYHCECEEGFQGEHCEIYHTNQKNLNIYSVKSAVILSEENEFAFTYNKTNSIVRQLFSNSTLGKNIDYYYHWKLTYIDQNGTEVKYKEEYDEKLFLNGFNEERFRLGKKALKEQFKNKITLTLTDVKENKNYTDELFVNVLISIDYLSLEIKYDGSKNNYTPMQTKVSIYVRDKATSRGDELYYQFFYYDEQDELIPLTGKTKESKIETLLPEARSAVVYVSNDRGEFIEMKRDLSYKEDTNKRTIYEILNSEHPPHIKTFYLNYYFCQKDKSLNNEELKTVLDFTWIQLSNKLESENNKVLNDEYNFVKPNLYISLLNKVANFIDKDEELSKDISNILAVNEIVSKAANQINQYKTPSISHDTWLSLYRNIDVLVGISEKYIKQENDNNNDDRLYKSSKESIKKMKNAISRQMYPGEQLKIIGKNIKTYLDQPGNDQDYLFIKKDNIDEKNYQLLSDYVFSTQFKGDKCDDFTLFCIEQNYFNNLYDEVTYLKENSLSKLTFSLIEISSSEKVKTIYNEDAPRTTRGSVLIDVFVPELNQSIINEITTLKYDVKLDLLSDDKNALKIYLSNASDEEKKRAELSQNKVCVPLNHLNNNIYYCYTYFNYQSNTQICRCNIADEIVGIFDKTTANFYKMLQFEKFKIENVNYFSGSLILSSLGLISIFSILLLIYDLFDDKKLAALDQLPKNQRVKHEYNELKCLKNANVFKFAWYLTYFKFPFFNVFSFYNYDHPRYFRFFIQVFALLLSMFFSALPYYKSKFERKEVFIDSRNVEQQSIDIHNFPYIFTDILSGFIFSVVASILINIIVLIFSKLMNFRKIRGKIWKPRKDYLLNYVYEEIKSDVLLGEKWHNIKIRILALNQLCSWKLLNKNKKETKFSKYLSYKNGVPFQPQAKSFAALELEKMRFSRSVSLENEPNVPLIPEEELVIENKFQSHCVYKDENEKDKDLIVIEKAVQPFTINRNTKGILPPSKIQKFERIKFKYIYNFNNNAINDDETENNSIIEQKYEIEQIENYTYISKNDFNKKEKEDTDCRNIIKNISLNIFLFGLLIGLYVIIVIVFHDIYQTYEGFIINAWLIPALFQVTLFRFAINYLFDLIITLILFKHINKRKTNKCLRVIFYLFIEKYMIYLNKIRLIISKYDKEFEFIQ